MDVGRPTDVKELTEDANNNGFRVGTYWALARGLAADITDAAWTNLDQPIRTPGLDELLTGVADSVRRCLASVDDAMHLGGEELPDSETMLALEMAVICSAQAHHQAAVLTRRIAQLGLGVSDYLEPGAHASDRLRQACIAVLYMYPFEPCSLVDDGLAVASRSRLDLYSELSGLLTRALLEDDTRFHIYVDPVFDPDQLGQRHFTVSVDDRVLRITGDTIDNEEWDHPMFSIDPARFIVHTIIDALGHDGHTLDGVRFSLI